jgi:hypothetical protein
MKIPTVSFPFPLALAAIVAVTILLAACDSNTTSSDPPYVRVHITQPLDSAVVRDSVLRVLITLDKNCGCQARAEFWIDGAHVFSDFVPDYSYDWDISRVTGPHWIKARGVVEGRAEGSDSVLVTINP